MRVIIDNQHESERSFNEKLGSALTVGDYGVSQRDRSTIESDILRADFEYCCGRASNSPRALPYRKHSSGSKGPKRSGNWLLAES
jgi:hypothetical protein